MLGEAWMLHCKMLFACRVRLACCVCNTFRMLYGLFQAMGEDQGNLTRSHYISMIAMFQVRFQIRCP